MLRTSTGFAACCALMAVAACANAERPPRHELTRVDSAGRAIVTNAVPADELRPVLTVDSVPILRIGVREGDEALLFDDVRGAVRLSDGRIAIANGTPPEIRIFNDAGTYVGKLGGRGRGPGEFSYLAGLMRGSGDTLLAVDIPAFRLMRFTPDGGYVDMRGVERDSVPRLLSGLRRVEGLREYFHDGSVMLAVGEPDPSGEGPDYPAGELFRPMKTIAWIAADYSSARVIGQFGEIQQMRVDLGGGRHGSIVPPSSRRRVSSMSSRGTRLCLTDNERPELHCIDADSSYLVVRWTQAEVPIDDVAIEAWRERERAWARENADFTSPQDMEKMLAAAIIPPTVPPVRTIVIDTDDRMLVGGPDLRADRSGWTRYRAFSADGALVGVADVPAMTIRELGADYLLGVVRDADEVQYVELYRVTRHSARDSRD